MSQYLLALDQGTTSSRAIIFSHAGLPLSQHQIEIKQYYPHDGWVEQDPEELWQISIECCQHALMQIKSNGKNIAAMGIANQRETTLMWDKKTGECIYPAIVWQDRRTSDYCKKMSQHPINTELHLKTGLVLDPYFSASKIVWLLDHVPHAREKAERGDLLFGTVDTFLLWRLTRGKVHATDATNASRTLLFNIHTQEWDMDIINAFNIPQKILPQVLDSSDNFGYVNAEIFGNEILVASMIGDQQAATVGQACFAPGMIKSTLGTGCFVLMNTGDQIIQSKNKLIATVAYRLQKKVTYGLEGSIFSAGSTIKWLRDKLKLINSAAETETLAQSVKSTAGVYIIPAFTGLGAPYWDSEARTAIFGLTSDSGKEQIVRAALEAVAYQSRDLLSAMQSDSDMQIKVLRVDGGMAANNWLLQFLADILNLEIQKPVCIETTALGAAFLAGLQVGIYKSLQEIADHWEEINTFQPAMNKNDAEKLYSNWLKFIKKIIHV